MYTQIIPILKERAEEAFKTWQKADDTHDRWYQMGRFHTYREMIGLQSAYGSVEAKAAYESLTEMADIYKAVNPNVASGARLELMEVSEHFKA